MAAPTAPEAAALYADLGAWVAEDESHGWAASTLCTAVMVGHETTGAVSRNPRLWVDPVAAPDGLIRNMAGRAGLRGAGGQTVQRLRDRLANPLGYEIGSSEAIAESARAVLTPMTAGVSALVTVRSNSNPATYPAYDWAHTTVVVHPAEAPDAAVVQAAAELGAPDWVVVHVVIGAGESIDETTGTIDSRSTPLDET